MACHSRRRVAVVLLSVLIGGCLLAAGSEARGDWKSFAIPTDVSKSGTAPYLGDNSGWLATAANMLGGAGYGRGRTDAVRAANIYQNLVTWNGGTATTGSVKSAMDWWLGSSNNIWKGNPYTATQVDSGVGSNANGLGQMGNRLRGGAFVSLEIAGSANHALTLWGDDGSAGNFAPGANPSRLFLSDSNDATTGFYTSDPSWDSHNSRWTLPYANGMATLANANTLSRSRADAWTIPLCPGSSLVVTAPTSVGNGLSNYWVYLVRTDDATSQTYALDISFTGSSLSQLLSNGAATPMLTTAVQLEQNLSQDTHFLGYGDWWVDSTAYDMMMIESTLAESSTELKGAMAFGKNVSPGWRLDQPVAEIVVPDGEFFTISGKYGAGTGDKGEIVFAPFAATSVPEPLTCSLLALGGLGLIRRRR